MKRSFCILSTLLFLFSFNTKAQESDIDLFVNDMLTIAGNFAQPAADGAAYQASAGWFSSAKALEKWDVRFSVHGNALFVPSSKKSFTLSNGQLTLLEIEGASNAKLPTAFGSTTEEFFTGNIVAEFNGQQIERNVRFKAFDGIEKDVVPHAFVQAAIGLPYGTEVTVRAMPEVTIDDVQASTYGIGVKHNFSQYSRFNDPEEDFQFAAGLSYSKFSVKYAYEPIEVEEIVTMDLIDVDANLFMAEAIASKLYGNFEVFGALGATSSQFNYIMGGSGQYLEDVNTALESLSDTKVQFKGDIGFNLYFNRFRVSAMATAGKFFNANLGLHFRI